MWAYMDFNIRIYSGTVDKRHNLVFDMAYDLPRLYSSPDSAI